MGKLGTRVNNRKIGCLSNFRLGGRSEKVNVRKFLADVTEDYVFFGFWKPSPNLDT